MEQYRASRDGNGRHTAAPQRHGTRSVAAVWRIAQACALALAPAIVVDDDGGEATAAEHRIDAPAVHPAGADEPPQRLRAPAHEFARWSRGRCNGGEAALL